MGLPANDNTTEVYDWRVVKIVTPETIPFPVKEDKKLHDLVFIGEDEVGYVGACEEAYLLADEGEGSADIHDGMEMQTDHLSADPTVNGFATINTEVWVDPATYLAQDTYAVGLRGVGRLMVAKDAAGVIQFKKRKYWINEPETPST